MTPENYSNFGFEYYEKGLTMKGIAASERKNVCTAVTRLYVETGQYDEAETFASRHAGEFSTAGGIYFYWGEALLKQGRKAEAKDKYKKAAGDPAWKDNALKRFHSIG